MYRPLDLKIPRSLQRVRSDGIAKGERRLSPHSSPARIHFARSEINSNKNTSWLAARIFIYGASLSGSFSASDLLEWHGFEFAKLWPKGKMQ